MTATKTRLPSARWDDMPDEFRFEPDYSGLPTYPNAAHGGPWPPAHAERVLPAGPLLLEELPPLPKPHGGYPTPTYDEAPARRRLTSHRLVGHTGAAVSARHHSDLFWAGEGHASPANVATTARIIEEVL